MAPLPPTARQANGDSSSTPVVATTNDGVLPLDLLYEILLCLPAKPLCRIRAVCRSWRSLLSDSSFVAAHNARHQPLVAVCTWDLERLRHRVERDGDEPMDVYILDMSGHVVKQMPVENCCQYYSGNGYVKCTNLDLVCVLGLDWRLRVLDPASGAVSVLPDDYIDHDYHTTFYVLGRASSTGESKVLGITEPCVERSQYCKVLTLGSGGEWRETDNPPAFVAALPRHVAVIKEVLYFLTSTDKRIAAYDLEKEKWRPDLLHHPPRPNPWDLPSLTELGDCLVAAYNNYGDASMELWFLADSEKVLWTKQYTITISNQGCRSPCDSSGAVPLWLLVDGRIVLWVLHCWKDGTQVNVLRVYNPRTNTYADIEMTDCYADIGMYRGSLLTALA